MTKNWLRRWEENDALITNSHVVLSPKKRGDEEYHVHSDGYAAKDTAFTHPLFYAAVAEDIADNWRDQQVQVVCGLEKGAIGLCQLVALRLSFYFRGEIRAVYAEKNPKGDGFLLGRGFDKVVRDKRVLIAEDVLSTGGGVSGAANAVRLCGGNVIGVGCMANRGRVTAAQAGAVPRLTSNTIVNDFQTWEEPDCPKCRDHVPVNTIVGHWREFFERNPDAKNWK